jgi:hypothetical protein
MGLLNLKNLLKSTKTAASDAGLITVEEDPSVQEAMEDHINRTWHWIRTTLDTGCGDYLHDGDRSLLEQCLAGQALDDVIAQLDLLIENETAWRFPPERRNVFDLRINSIIDDTWVVTEHFTDHSTLEVYRDGTLQQQIEGDGLEKAIRATVVAQDNSYYITQVVMVADPSVED